MKNMILLFIAILGLLSLQFIKLVDPNTSGKNNLLLTVVSSNPQPEILEKMAIRRIEAMMASLKGIKKVSVDINQEYAIFNIELKTNISKSDIALNITDKIRSDWEFLKAYIRFPEWNMEQSTYQLAIADDFPELNHYWMEENSNHPILNIDAIPTYYLNGLPAQLKKIRPSESNFYLWILLLIWIPFYLILKQLDVLYIHFGLVGSFLCLSWLLNITPTNIHWLTIILIQIWSLFSITKNKGFFWSELLFFTLFLLSEPSKDWILVVGIQLGFVLLLKWDQKKPAIKTIAWSSPLAILPLCLCTWQSPSEKEEDPFNLLRIQFDAEVPAYLIENLHNELLTISSIKKIEKENNELITIYFDKEDLESNDPVILQNEIERWLNSFGGFDYAIYGLEKNQLTQHASIEHQLSIEMKGYDFDLLKIRAFDLATDLKKNERVSNLSISSGNRSPSSSKYGILQNLNTLDFQQLTENLEKLSDIEKIEWLNNQKCLIKTNHLNNHALYTWLNEPIDEKSLPGNEYIKEWYELHDTWIKKINQQFVLTIQFNFIGSLAHAQQFLKKSRENIPYTKELVITTTEKKWGLFFVVFLIHFGFTTNLWSGLIGGLPIYGNYAALLFIPEITPAAYEFGMLLGLAFSSMLISSGNIPPLIIFLIGGLCFFINEFVPVFFQLLTGSIFYPLVFKKSEA
jgi:hypothetical protein